MRASPTSTSLRQVAGTVQRAWSLAHPAPQEQPHRPDTDPGAEAGMATAEYAIGTLAAAAFAGLLLAVIRSGGLQDTLLGLIQSALSVG